MEKLNSSISLNVNNTSSSPLGDLSAIKNQPTTQTRNISIKHSLPHLYVIESGLTSNDKIVYEGIQTVKEGDKILTDFVHIKQVISLIKSNNNG